MQAGKLKRTPIYDEHVKLGGHLVEFAGWEMPLYYGSIIEEHMAVRQKVGLFDVSHMGELLFSGNNAAAELDRLSTNGLLDAKKGSCTYTHHLDEDGRIIDDTIATRISDEEFLTVPNASKTDEVLSWVRANLKCSVTDASSNVCCLALQGPNAAQVMQKIVPDATQLASFTGMFSKGGQGPFASALENGEIFVSRTGYTGEDGFELFVHSKDGAATWRRLLEEGKELGIRPVGLGARDSLRLEKCYLLSGTDFDGKQSTLETGYNWIINWNHDFVGKGALLRQKEEGGYPKLASILTEGKLIPRHGDSIRSNAGEGRVTSGGYSPILGKAVAMGYITPWARPDESVELTVRGRAVPGRVIKPPFIRGKK